METTPLIDLANPRQTVGVTGASGFLGHRVVEEIIKAGARACCYSRNAPPGMQGCTEVRPFRYSGINVHGVNAIVHLAGESIFGLWTETKKKRILESRRDGTQAVVDSILAAGEDGPKTLICASAIGFYGDTGEQTVDEDAPPGKDFLTEVTQVWEKEALRAESGGVRVVILRFGIILAREGGILKKLRPLFLAGLGSSLGDGRQWVSWIHAGDAANLVLHALRHPGMKGAYNAVAPHPLRQIDFAQALARKWQRKVRFSIPAWLLMATLGELATVMLSSQKVVSKRLQETGFQFFYPEL